MKSDSDLRDDIQVELSRQFSAHTERIDVHVLDGVVTLTGQVTSALDRWRLDVALRSVTAVRGLVDETMVDPEPPGASPDLDTARPWFPAG